MSAEAFQKSQFGNEAEKKFYADKIRKQSEEVIKTELRNLYLLGLSSDKISEILTYLHLDVIRESKK